MAQAFKFPTEAYDSVLRGPAFGSLALTRRLFGSPLPSRPGKAGSAARNMGLPPARRKRAKT